MSSGGHHKVVGGVGVQGEVGHGVRIIGNRELRGDSCGGQSRGQARRCWRSLLTSTGPSTEDAWRSEK